MWLGQVSDSRVPDPARSSLWSGADTLVITLARKQDEENHGFHCSNRRGGWPVGPVGMGTSQSSGDQLRRLRHKRGLPRSAGGQPHASELHPETPEWRADNSRGPERQAPDDRLLGILVRSLPP